MQQRRVKTAATCAAFAVVFALLVVGLSSHYPQIRNKLQQKIQAIDVRLNLDEAVQNNNASLLSVISGDEAVHSPECWIAHGGGIGQYVYTNSKEAVLDSLQRGFRYIELDLLKTTDGFLVAVHDWKTLRRMVGSQEVTDEPLSRSEILQLKARWKLTPLFAEDIRHMMQENPEMILVTDKMQDFEFLAREIPFCDRMIVEAFSCYHYLMALRNGFSNVALTAWSVHDMQQAQKYRLPGVVLAASSIASNATIRELVPRLHQDGCCIMVHWAVVSDKPEFIYSRLGKNISRIYTDTWGPMNVPPRQ